MSPQRIGASLTLAMLTATVLTLQASPATGVAPTDEWQPVGSTELISRSSQGRPGSLDSFTPALSAAGRYVTYASFADNLPPGEASELEVYLHDRTTGTTIRVSESPRGAV